MDGDGLAGDLDVHPPLGQIAPAHLDIRAGAPDAVQDGQQDVEVVHEPVSLRQHRPGDPVAVVAAQRADQQPPARLRFCSSVNRHCAATYLSVAGTSRTGIPARCSMSSRLRRR